MRLSAVIASCLMLAACSEKAKYDEVAKTTAAEAKADSRPLVMGWSDGHMPEGASILIDNETGCQYIHSKWGYGEAITPRLNAAGKPMCGEPKP